MLYFNLGTVIHLRKKYFIYFIENNLLYFNLGKVIHFEKNYLFILLKIIMCYTFTQA